MSRWSYCHRNPHGITEIATAIDNVFDGPYVRINADGTIKELLVPIQAVAWCNV